MEQGQNVSKGLTERKEVAEHMCVWDVKVLYLGKIRAPMSILWPMGMPPLPDDFILDGPYLGFLLQSEGRNILVDSGISEKFIVDGKAWSGLPAEGGRAYLEKALEKEGLNPADIDIVIYTHLHNDHAANCTLFTNARIIFQRDEWKNLLNPLPVQLLRRDYDLDVIPELKSMNTLMVDGDFKLTDGINIYKTPGHTLGSQSIAVNTNKGVVVFTGDLFVLNFSAFPYLGEVMDMHGRKYSIPKAPPVFGPAVPVGGLVYDFYTYYDSVYKVKAIASRSEPGFIIPGHEGSLLVTGI